MKIAKKITPSGRPGDGLKREYPDLITAVRLNDYEAAESMLIEDPGAVLQTDKTNMTPLHWAAARNNIEMVSLILGYDPSGSYRALVNMIDIYGRAPIELAFGNGNQKLTELLSKAQFPDIYDPESDWNKEWAEDSHDPEPEKVVKLKPPEPE